jgi:hypothetical protein
MCDIHYVKDTPFRCVPEELPALKEVLPKVSILR